MLTNSIIDDEKGDSLEYRRIIKHDKHKNIWVKYFVEELVVGDIVQGTKTILSLVHEKISTDRIKDFIY